MIILRIAMTATSENSAHLRAILEANHTATKEFEGCQRSDLFPAMDNDNCFFIYEEWDSQASFDAYRKSSYFDELGGKVFPLLSDRPEAAYYHAEKFA